MDSDEKPLLTLASQTLEGVLGLHEPGVKDVLSRADAQLAPAVEGLGGVSRVHLRLGQDEPSAGPARDILLTQAVATLVAGGCGGVAQTTPYIGQPAYKVMGARAGYTVLTGLFIGLGGVQG